MRRFRRRFRSRFRRVRRPRRMRGLRLKFSPRGGIRL
ncbi:hypothetical protein [Sigmofec virus UA08Rod_7382]|uniref:Uncharacterized protein n=1 Tax=Sigmofec virus UA08Rod_7382 TaxID=2929246 RepID=A0A976N017_9VIRU|nr:hypothetical protein [Sigmofec virus UA08Rod_7382]